MSATKSERLRTLLATDTCVLAPGVFDPVTAKLSEAAGFKIGYLSGYVLQAANMGLPNVGLTTLTEYVNLIGRVADVVEIPVVASGASGFGGVLEVTRTITQFEKAGAAGIQLGDQAHTWSPHSNVASSLLPVEVAATKLRAAKEAQSDPDFLLIAATYAVGIETVDEVVARCQAYAEGGADMILPLMSKMMPYTGSTATKEERLDILRQIVAEVPCSIATHSPHGDDIDLAECNELGIKLYVQPNLCLGTAVAAVRGALSALAEGRLGPFLAEHPPHSVRDLSEILGIAKYEDLARRFGSAAG